MTYKSIPVPPPDYKGTLAEWKALTSGSQYRIVNRVKKAAANKLWLQQNYRDQEAKKRLWRQKNKEKVAAFKKQWKQQNPEKVTKYQHKSYIKKERAFFEMFGPMGII